MSPTLGSALLLVPLCALLGQTATGPGFVVPDFADLTIKTHSTTGDGGLQVSAQTLYLKGARQRRELTIEGRPTASHTTITRCDERRWFDLNADAKIYAVFPVEDWSERLTHRQPVREPAGVEVTITWNAVDTGERRRIGHYVARRVRTTENVEPGPGANTRASTRETDGWYIDLSGLDCSNGVTATALYAETIKPGALPDHRVYKTIGTARRGYAIEETTRFTQEGASTLTRIELIEFSEAPLDVALFEIPPDYRPALPLLHGGYDMTKPDTFAGRLQSYWSEFTLWARGVFH